MKRMYEAGYQQREREMKDDNVKEKIDQLERMMGQMRDLIDGLKKGQVTEREFNFVRGQPVLVKDSLRDIYFKRYAAGGNGVAFNGAVHPYNTSHSERVVKWEEMIRDPDAPSIINWYPWDGSREEGPLDPEGCQYEYGSEILVLTRNMHVGCFVINDAEWRHIRKEWDIIAYIPLYEIKVDWDEN